METIKRQVAGSICRSNACGRAGKAGSCVCHKVYDIGMVGEGGGMGDHKQTSVLGSQHGLDRTIRNIIR